MLPSQTTATAAARRYLALVLSVLLAAGTLALLTAAPARAAVETTTIDGISYSVNTGTPAAGATVIRYDSSFGPVAIIPNTINVGGTSYAVTAIGAQSFASREISSVELPDTLTAIGDDAFYNNLLTSVTLPDTVTTLGEYAFAGNHLASATLPDSLTTIGYRAFAWNRMTSVALPDSLTALGEEAFYANLLASVTLPGTLTTIGNSTFASNRLTSIDLPDALATLGDDAFFANDLRSVILPDALTRLGAGAFRANHALTQVRFTGPVPTTIAGADHVSPSLGTAPGLSIEFPARHLGPTPQTGYTTPEWLGYATMPAYTVTFDAGNGSPINPVTNWPGETPAMPTDPVRPEFAFTGWYTTPQAETAFDPALHPSSDITVYAGWQPLPPTWSSAELGVNFARSLAIGDSPDDSQPTHGHSSCMQSPVADAGTGCQSGPMSSKGGARSRSRSTGGHDIAGSSRYSHHAAAGIRYWAAEDVVVVE